MVRFAWLGAAILAGLLVLGCSSSEDEARVRVAALGWPEDKLPLEAVRVDLDDGASRRTVEGSGLRLDPEYGQPHSAWFETPVEGQLIVTVTLRGHDGSTLERGTVELDLRPDWGWEVQLHWAVDDPAATCFGCEGSVALGVDEGQGRLWLVWGGNFISNPVVH